MIDVRKLSMLEALARLGTLSAVADEFRLTAPGVSMQLGAFERELGLTLTERQGRRLALTPAGRLLASHGRDLLDRLSLAEREVEGLHRGTIGTYRLAAFPTAARTFVADTWKRLIQDGSGVSLELTTPEPEEALTALSAGRIDLAVIHSYSNVPRHLPHGVEAEPIATEPVWLAIRSDDPAAAPIVELSLLHRHPWIAAPPGVTCHEMTERACGLAGYRPRIAAQSMDFASQLALVAAGAGAALIPELAADLIPDGVQLSRPATPIHRHIQAARRTSLHAEPGLDRITHTLRETAGQRLQTPTR